MRPVHVVAAVFTEAVAAAVMTWRGLPFLACLFIVAGTSIIVLYEYVRVRR